MEDAVVDYILAMETANRLRAAQLSPSPVRVSAVIAITIQRILVTDLTDFFSGQLANWFFSLPIQSVFFRDTVTDLREFQ